MGEKRVNHNTFGPMGQRLQGSFLYKETGDSTFVFTGIHRTVQRTTENYVLLGNMKFYLNVLHC